MEMPNLSDGDVISVCISKDAFMKAPDKSSIKKDFTEKATEYCYSFLQKVHRFCFCIA